MSWKGPKAETMSTVDVQPGDRTAAPRRDQGEDPEQGGRRATTQAE